MAIFQRELALENKSDIRYALQRMTIKELIQFEDRLRKLGMSISSRGAKNHIMISFILKLIIVKVTADEFIQ